MQDENAELLKNYQKMFRLSVEHIKHCRAFEHAVKEEFDSEDEENARAEPRPALKDTHRKQQEKGFADR